MARRSETRKALGESSAASVAAQIKSGKCKNIVLMVRRAFDGACYTTTRTNRLEQVSKLCSMLLVSDTADLGASTSAGIPDFRLVLP